MVHLKNLQDNIQDTSRSGKYHNKRFKDTAEQYGLVVEKSEKYGWCRTSLNAEAAAWLKVEYPKVKSGTASGKQRYRCVQSW